MANRSKTYSHKGDGMDKLIGNKVAKNALWIIGCKVVQAVLGLIVSLLTARYLGPSNFGVINYAASVTAFAVPIMNLGFSNVCVQELTNYPKDEGKIVGTSIVLSFISALFCIFGICIYTFSVDRGQPVTNYVVIIYSLMLVAQACELFQYWFQAKLISKYMSIISLVAYVLISLYKVVLLIVEADVYWFALSYSLDYLLISVGLFVAYTKLGGMSLGFSLDVGKRMFSSSKHYILSSLMVSVLGQTDKIMIKLMIDESAVGHYSAAYTCAGMSSFVFLAIIDSFRPVILGYKRDGRIQDFERLISRLYFIVFYLALLQCIVMTLFAPLIIQCLYGTDYKPSVVALQIIVWYTTFAYMGSVRNIWILSEGVQKYLWVLNLSGAAINVILNLILIRVYGIYGAALASLITQFLTNVIMNQIIAPLRYNNRLMLLGVKPTNIRTYLIPKMKKEQGKNEN